MPMVWEEDDGMSDRLDKAIADTAYILDCLMALRNIYETGCCNECTFAHGCTHEPKLGQMVRYNCPFFEREEST